MKSTIRKIPLPLIGIMLAFAAINVTPQVLLHAENQRDLTRLEGKVDETVKTMQSTMITPTLSVSPVATPSVSLKPTPAVNRVILKPTITPIKVR